MHNKSSHCVMCRATDSFGNITNPLLSPSVKVLTNKKYKTKRGNIVRRGLFPFSSPFVRRRIWQLGSESAEPAVHDTAVAWQHDDVGVWRRADDGMLVSYRAMFWLDEDNRKLFGISRGSDEGKLDFSRRRIGLCHVIAPLDNAEENLPGMKILYWEL